MRIIYLDIDALRPDHLGCYGYPRRTSPHIDAIAKQGVTFTQCHTSDAPCLPSRTALYSGRFGFQTGVIGHGGTAAQPRIEGPTRGFRDLFDFQGLARQLQLAGYHTAMISPFGQRHAAWWFYAGFHEIHNTGNGGLESAEQIDPVLFEWLDRHANSDHWFLHVNFWDAHTPYRVPSSFGNPFADDPLPRWLDDDALIQRHAQLPGPHSILDLSMYDDQQNPRYPRQPGRVTDRTSMRQLIDGYDTAIRYVDDRIGRIIATLQRAGVHDDTAIIISADHGENFGELGLYAEHATADAATCRVPMIVRWPGMSSGGRDDRLRYNIDLAPTLMDLLGGSSCPLWDGRSFANVLRGRPDTGHQQLVLSQGAHVCQRSVRWDRWLYMQTLHCGFHLFPREMLFDLANDPHEQHDLATAHPSLVAEGARRLGAWHAQQMSRLAPGNEDPMQTVLREGGPFHARHTGAGSPLPSYLQRLRRTGRADAADQLAAKYLSTGLHS